MSARTAHPVRVLAYDIGTALTANEAARATAAKRSPGLDRTTGWSDPA